MRPHAVRLHSDRSPIVEAHPSHSVRSGAAACADDAEGAADDPVADRRRRPADWGARRPRSGVAAARVRRRSLSPNSPHFTLGDRRSRGVSKRCRSLPAIRRAPGRVSASSHFAARGCPLGIDEALGVRRRTHKSSDCYRDHNRPSDESGAPHGLHVPTRFTDGREPAASRPVADPWVQLVVATPP